MAAITERSINHEPLLKVGKLNHGTLTCKDVVVSRRFYEEVLGLEVTQTSPVSLMIRKGSNFVYAVVEMPTVSEMEMLHHNGFEVTSRAEVDKCYERLTEIKAEWGLRKVMKPRLSHGDYSLYFCDMDGNWWEIVTVETGSYVSNFSDDSMDLTGRHDLHAFVDVWNDAKRIVHLHDPEVRATAKRH